MAENTPDTPDVPQNTDVPDVVPFPHRYYYPRDWDLRRDPDNGLVWNDPDLDPEKYPVEEYTVVAPSLRHIPLQWGYQWVWVRVLDTEDVIDLMWDTGMHTSFGHIVLSLEPKLLWDIDQKKAVPVDTFRGMVPDVEGHRATRMVLWDRADMPVAHPSKLFLAIKSEFAKKYYEDLLKPLSAQGYYNQIPKHLRKILEDV